MLTFQPQLAARANAFQSAMNELSQLAAAGGGKGTGLSVSEAVKRLAGNLRYARASRVQLVVTDWLLQKEIEQELRRIRPRTPQDFLQEIRRHPKAVMRLPGYMRIRQRVVESVLAEVNVMQLLALVVSESPKQRADDGRYFDKQFSLASIAIKQKTEVVKQKSEEFANESENLIKEIAIGVAIIVGEQVNRGLDALGLPDEIGDEIGDQVTEGGEEAIDHAEEAANCMEEAARNRDACNSFCPPGRAGNACRGACEASYVADLARCMVS